MAPLSAARVANSRREKEVTPVAPTARRGDPTAWWVAEDRFGGERPRTKLTGLSTRGRISCECDSRHEETSVCWGGVRASRCAGPLSDCQMLC